MMRRLLSFVLAFVVLASAFAALSPTIAQAGDLDATLKRFKELYAAGNYSAALVEAQNYESAVRVQFGTNHAKYSSALTNLGRVYEAQGQYGEAEGFYQRALDIDEKALGASHSNVAVDLNDLANVFKEQGKYGEAEGLYRRALAIKEKALGSDHPDVSIALNNLAGAFKDQGKYGEAEGLYQRALAIREKALGASHPDVAKTLNNLAIVYKEQGKYGEAEGLLQRALAISGAEGHAKLAAGSIGPKRLALRRNWACRAAEKSYASRVTAALPNVHSSKPTLWMATAVPASAAGGRPCGGADCDGAGRIGVPASDMIDTNSATGARMRIPAQRIPGHAPRSNRARQLRGVAYLICPAQGILNVQILEKQRPERLSHTATWKDLNVQKIETSVFLPSPDATI
jgi:tetratricopeptide (TPR) repeat protein